MQFDAEILPASAITGYGQQGISINKQWHSSSLFIGSDGLLQPWNATEAADNTANRFTVDALQSLAALLEQNAHHPYELLLLGTGSKQVFIPAQHLQPFIAQGIAMESMSTHAACRTYNIVASEGRRVLAALWLDNLSNHSI